MDTSMPGFLQEKLSKLSRLATRKDKGELLQIAQEVELGADMQNTKAEIIDGLLEILMKAEFIKLLLKSASDVAEQELIAHLVHHLEQLPPASQRHVISQLVKLSARGRDRVTSGVKYRGGAGPFGVLQQLLPAGSC